MRVIVSVKCSDRGQGEERGEERRGVMLRSMCCVSARDKNIYAEHNYDCFISD
jgi:hypothetical protein